jgi:hypothetical protein
MVRVSVTGTSIGPDSFRVVGTRPACVVPEGLAGRHRRAVALQVLPVKEPKAKDGGTSGQPRTTSLSVATAGMDDLCRPRCAILQFRPIIGAESPPGCVPPGHPELSAE